MQRSHNRELCFFSEEDYETYLYWLDRALGETGCTLRAYVLMTNHAHLLLMPLKAVAVLTLVMTLGRRCVQYINRIYQRTGTLWDDRYKSSAVQAETYLMTASVTSNSTPCAPPLWTTPRYIGGAATAAMRWARPILS